LGFLAALGFFALTGFLHSSLSLKEAFTFTSLPDALRFL
jgi:hypothetical protein